jgi:hypothetical protein
LQWFSFRCAKRREALCRHLPTCNFDARKQFFTGLRAHKVGARSPTPRDLRGEALFFIIKCLACIALVLFVMQLRGEAALSPPAGGLHRAAAPTPPRRPETLESARDLTQAGAKALFAAASERCLAAPHECATILQRLQGAGRDRRAQGAPEAPVP